MAAREPTEAPTPRRLEEARRRGEVATSRDLVSACATAAAVIALVAGGPATLGRLLGYWKRALAPAALSGGAGPALAGGLDVLCRVLAPPLAAACAVALLVGLAQTRGLVALGAIEPRLSRLWPADGLRRLAGGAGALQVGKGLLKAAVVAFAVWCLVPPQLRGLSALAGAPAGTALAAVGALAARLAGWVALVGLALGIGDLLLVRRTHLRRLRMTREQVQREHKESEGDPLHRAERQRLHRALLEQRMIADVRKASFVVVNPDHIAVALRYDAGSDAAPVVVASGERLVAERIKQEARAAGVPIFRDVTLARSLRQLPDGAEIPAALYEAVAEVLRVVQGLPAPAGGQTSGSGVVPGATGWKRA